MRDGQLRLIETAGHVGMLSLEYLEGEYVTDPTFRRAEAVCEAVQGRGGVRCP